MSMTDPIADFLARIRNGISARKQQIELGPISAFPEGEFVVATFLTDPRK